MLRFTNATRGALLADQARVAATFLSRLRGLIGTRPLAPGEALYLSGCKQIHMFWMTFAIDVVFMDGEGVAVGLVERIGPNAVSPYFKAARNCLELPAGVIAASGTQVGDRIAREPAG